MQTQGRRIGLRSFGLLAAVAASVVCAAVARADEDSQSFSPALREQAVAQLRCDLNHDDHTIRTLAAKTLVALDYPEGARELLRVESGPNRASAMEVFREFAARGENRDNKVLHANVSLAETGSCADLPLLTTSLEGPDAAARVAAAWAILRVERRLSRSLPLFDWFVLTLYMVGMLAIGWYYSRMNVTEDDYLLAGRNMRSWLVGVSLFATLMSTLTYLSIPGEVIKYGPMVLAGWAATPLIIWVVGWVFIPLFMKLRISSAYQILEERLGLTVRMVGTSFFLATRLMWMSMIIYATIDLVLVPIIGIDPKWEPLLGVVLGAVTVVYTSMGGLKAVVVTDVVQAFILFAGAIVSILLVTFSFGGFDWFPTSWPTNWAPAAFAFDFGGRLTFGNAMLTVFIWYICTSGSDQLAVQRYLATRDVKAARRAFTINMVAGILILTFLALLGLALLSYFRVHPHLVPDGKTINTAADALFPRYIVDGLPVGLSGLVIAGLLAAAMSSLSAGLNSSCSVIMTDLIDRFRRTTPTEAAQVRLAKLISWSIGAAVVLISLLVGRIGGSLLELIHKVGNLLVVPLFVLFFMALFVPWATSFGTLAAAAASVAAAIAISFFEIYGLQFPWIGAGALLAGIIVGPIVSLLPTGRRAGWRK